MKKVTVSVAALIIAMNSYSQCTMSYEDSLEAANNNHAREITMTAEDMIDSIKYDVENGRIYKEYAELYIENLLEIVSRVEDLDCQGKFYSSLDCENCDEID